MNQQLLALFPQHIHPLTIVSDPDRLLAGEGLMLELSRRGFQVIQEDDPILLRHRVEEAGLFSPENPVIISTTGVLEDLPYDLYQPANRIRLSLHHYFPNLAYPVLQTLSPDQIEKLEACQQPDQTLSRQKTIAYLLREVFGADPTALNQPHALIAWLNDYHQQRSQLPELLRTSLAEGLKVFAIYKEWDIDLLLQDAFAFQSFIQSQWQKSIDLSLSGRNVKEPGAEYCVQFQHDPQLQDLVPGLVRGGTIQPLRIETHKEVPTWAQPGVTLVDARLQRLSTLLEDVSNQLTVLKANSQAGWNTWMQLAQNWAELSSYMTSADLDNHPLQKETYQNLAGQVDPLFSGWLKDNYSALGAQRLPKPHHVHHIPHFLAYLRSLGKIDKVVLLVLDGLSLADWQVIQSIWVKRHSDWMVNEEALLAQIPTITSLSRYALVSGLRPADFAGEVNHIMPESRAWELFWSREGINENACRLIPLYYDRQIDQQPELLDPMVNFWCLIDDTPDKLAHNASLGAADQQSSLRLWLDPANEQNSMPLEKMIDSFLDRGYFVFIASDHGHVEATGIGQPSEGLLAQTRGKRARIYKDHLAAIHVQNVFADSILWENEGILPDQMTALMPAKRQAFAPSGEVVVTHGGISIDEAVVPFIQLKKERK